MIIHAIVLLSTFMVRYNAIYYPFVSICVISFASVSIREKVKSLGFILLLLGAFVGHTGHKYFINTGAIQYSAFGGWQLAANALYGYAYAIPDAPEKIPIKFRQLHSLVNQHMDSLRSLSPLRRPDGEVAIYYLWDERAPLKTYLRLNLVRDTTRSFFTHWATLGPLYGAYGRYLIQEHPWLFVKYYIWPNLIKYYAPPAKFMGVYNLEEDTVDPITVMWFGWKDNKIHPRYMETKIKITELFTVLMAVINLVFILSFIAFLSLSGFKRGCCIVDVPFGGCLLYGEATWVLVSYLRPSNCAINCSL